MPLDALECSMFWKFYGRYVLANILKLKSKIKNYVEDEIKKFYGRPLVIFVIF